MQFYLQNFDNYQRINENYNKVYEKEKSLKLIKCAEHTKGDVDEL